MEPPRATYSLAEFKALLPLTGRLIGLDVGTETIGVAASDASRLIASPDLTLYRRKWSEDTAALSAMMEGQNMVGFVVGYPLNMDGSAGPRAQATRAFARNLQAEFPLPLLLWDERLSTAAVTRMMRDEADLSRARRDVLVDKLAASYILQGVLDALKIEGALQ
ncbi:MAG: Holliday junction resolvase RuvX [Alphaproteobacteria bacterium]|nr:Holliday junction resolvase RuvX [Alphaproteobacteria bacterium]